MITVITGVASIFSWGLWILLMGATGLFLARLFWIGLWRVYPWLVTFFALDMVQQIARFWSWGNSAFLYEIGNTIKIPVIILVLWDLASRGFADHPALARFSRRASWNVVGVCLTIAAVNLFFDPAVPADRSPRLHYFMTVERSILSGVLLFVLTLGLFMLWFPVRMRRNVALYLSGFCTYFAVQWIALLVANRWGPWTHVTDVVAHLVSLVCLLYWTFAIHISGEQAMTVTGHRWNPGEMDRVAEQLDAIHARLIRLNR